MPKGKRPVLSVEQQRAIKSLTFHAAQDTFHIEFQTWKAIREADGFLPFRGNGDALAELEERALTHIDFKTFGHLRSPRGQAQQHEVPFALVMERRAKGTFEAGLREPPDHGATTLSRPAPNVTLAN